MRRHASRVLALATLLAASVAVPAVAGTFPWDRPFVLGDADPGEETTYVERSLNRQAPLTIEHPPVPRGRAGGDRAAIAGFCYEGGYVTRHDAFGRPILRQREVCDNVAPRTLRPGDVDPRPVWPAVRRVPRERARVVRARG